MKSSLDKKLKEVNPFKLKSDLIDFTLSFLVKGRPLGSETLQNATKGVTHNWIAGKSLTCPIRETKGKIRKYITYSMGV